MSSSTSPLHKGGGYWSGTPACCGLAAFPSWLEDTWSPGQSTSCGCGARLRWLTGPDRPRERSRANSAGCGGPEQWRDAVA
eukprot:7952170-Lingulodinium_polyedra.AAC.1